MVESVLCGRQERKTHCQGQSRNGQRHGPRLLAIHRISSYHPKGFVAPLALSGQSGAHSSIDVIRPLRQSEQAILAADHAEPAASQCGWSARWIGSDIGVNQLLAIGRGARLGPRPLLAARVAPC